LECLVIGLGVFGKSIALNLAKEGISVTGIDISEKALQEIAPYLKEGLKLDVTIEDNLKLLGIEKFDIIFVCIGVNMQASLVTTWILKNLGAQKIIARSNSEIHSKLLEKLGADRVITPEIEMGKKIALEVTTNFESFFELSEELIMVKIPVFKELIKKSIKELNIRKKYNINIIAIEKNTIQVTKDEDKFKKVDIKIPEPEDILENYDILYLLGKKQSIKRFMNDYS